MISAISSFTFSPFPNPNFPRINSSSKLRGESTTARSSSSSSSANPAEKVKFGDAYRQWQVDAPNFVIDDHYPVRELWARARSCWNRILAHNSKFVLVVAHNAVNQALIASSIGLGTGYFRRILQSNCGVSALDFIPRAADGAPHVCLNRLNETPNSPIVAGSSGGRNTSQQIILVCRGSLNNVAEACIL